MEQNDDGFVPHVVERSMKEIGVVVLLIPQDCAQRTVEQIVDMMHIFLLERAEEVPLKCFFDRGARSCLFFLNSYPNCSSLLLSTVVRDPLEGNSCFSRPPHMVARVAHYTKIFSRMSKVRREILDAEGTAIPAPGQARGTIGFPEQ